MFRLSSPSAALHIGELQPAADALVPVAASASCQPALTEPSCGPTSSCEVSTCTPQPDTESGPWSKAALEVWNATSMVVRYMLLAWLIGAVIKLYVPDAWVIATLGKANPLAILSAAIFGIPAYTSNLAAMPLIGSLLENGMDPAAALAFLIAGPTTTLPAMSAVWGIVNRRVFALYISFSLVGSLVLGVLYKLISTL
jgi:uncharacterized membrane protein YraQ (UPF0718 family)